MKDISELPKVYKDAKGIYTLCRDEQENYGIWNAKKGCKGKIRPQWSGVKCDTCSGWYCF